MIKEREQQIKNIFGVFDVILSLLSFAAAFLIRDLFFEQEQVEWPCVDWTKTGQDAEHNSPS